MSQLLITTLVLNKDTNQYTQYFTLHDTDTDEQRDLFTIEGIDDLTVDDKTF